MQPAYRVASPAMCVNASAARLSREIMHGSAANESRERYLALLKSGGNDYPMEQLKKAGVDLAKPDTVKAVIDQLDDLVTRLEAELHLGA